MICPKCGAELKDDARFCYACGAPVTTNEAFQESEGGYEDAPSLPENLEHVEPGGASPFVATGLAQPDAQQPRGKLSPRAIILLLLALLVVVTVVVVIMANQGGQSSGTGQPVAASSQSGSAAAPATASQPAAAAASSTSSQSDGSATPQANGTAPSSTSQPGSSAQGPASAQAGASAAGASTQAAAAAEPAPQLSQEEQVIKSLDGWWQRGARQWLYDGYVYYHDGKRDRFTADGAHDGSLDPITPDLVHRHDAGLQGAKGTAFIDTPGYFIDVNHGSLGFYLADDSPDSLSWLNEDGSGYSGGETIGRVEPPEWAADALASIGVSDGGGAAAPAAAPTDAQASNQAQAQPDAREAAVAAGKQVFTGTIRATTDEEAWVMSIGKNPNAGSYYTNRPVTILLLDQKTSIEGTDPTSQGGYKTLQNQDVIELPDSFASYDGQRVEMAFSIEELQMPSDVSHIKGTGEVISTGASIAPAATASAGDYVLADSSTRTYSRSELEAFDNHTLFLARNELFARHGCGFRTQELRDWFASKSWYRETIPAGTYGTEVLNDAERANAELMRAIETERNSPYL